MNHGVYTIGEKVFVGNGVDSEFAVNAWAAPLLLLPLFLTDAQGRRWVGNRTGLSIFVVGVSIILAFLTTVNWHLVAPYAETSFVTLQAAFNGSSTFNLISELPHSWVTSLLYRLRICIISIFSAINLLDPIHQI